MTIRAFGAVHMSISILDSPMFGAMDMNISFTTFGAVHMAKQAIVAYFAKSIAFECAIKDISYLVTSTVMFTTIKAMLIHSRFIIIGERAWRFNNTLIANSAIFHPPPEIRRMNCVALLAWLRLATSISHAVYYIASSLAMALKLTGVQPR